jgi:hypothetical protein
MSREDDVVEELQALMQGIPLILPKDGWHKKEFTQVCDGLKAVTFSLLAAVSNIDGQFKQYKLGDKAALLILLRNIKAGIGGLSKTINKIEPYLEQDMCMAISEQGLHQFQTDTHTLSAKAEAYLSKSPKEGDEKWAEFEADADVSALERVMIPPRDLERLCRDRLEQGMDLPPGCEVYVRATVGVRKRA